MVVTDKWETELDYFGDDFGGLARYRARPKLLTL